MISAFAKERMVILSTHIVSDVEFIAEEIIMMKSGQIVQFGELQNIISEINEQKNSVPGNQTEEPEQQRAGGHGVPELVPEWVDGQEYPQGEDELVDDGTNVPSDGSQKEEPNQYNIGFN